MLYTGNLLIGRFDTILAVSEALEKINAQGTKILLDVYTGSYIAPEDRDKLSQYVILHSAVAQSEVFQLQSQADILLFAEAMTGENSQIARLSFSTKLTDYFRWGKCILAIGAGTVAPMEYLKKENAALCATNQAEIYEQLQAVVSQPGVVRQMAENAYLCGMKNHNRQLIQRKVDQTFQKLMKQ